MNETQALERMRQVVRRQQKALGTEEIGNRYSKNQKSKTS